MEIVQIVAVGMIAAILALTLKKQQPEFALTISIAASVLIFFMIIPWVATMIDVLLSLVEMVDRGKGYIYIVLKIIGIAYITEFGVQICMDAGESAIASKIELAGKVLIMLVSTPILVSLVELIGSILA